MTWITENDYFGPWWGHEDITEDVRKNSDALLSAVNDLMNVAFEAGVDFTINPSTKSHISGQTLGGFRPKNATQGAPLSGHKRGMSVDVFDGKVGEGQKFARWCHNNQDKLKARGLHMEHYSATVGKNTCWCHLSILPPDSGKIVYFP